ncbi:MAG: hypothetical protein K940chlam1_01344, partial [Candidatus Anoxychlamydiales bacterium]|nr:hypothetical protein [Candidatus Anoxychlamydiales bacterium]
DLLKRLGLKKYNFEPKDKSPIIWIHAVSLGETKASKVLIKKLKIEKPNSYIILSSMTQTGNIEAKTSHADICVFFPFDFSFSVKNVFSQIKPDLIIFIETDFWPNFIKQAKKNNTKLIIASAKISLKSTLRFSKFLKKFFKEMFSSFDLILTQNELYKERFSLFTPPDKIHITGNLKFTNTNKTYSKEFLDQWLDKLNAKNTNLITIASTHNPEEEMLTNTLKDIPNLKILLAPRHPERFHSVFNQIQKITPCCLLSDLTNPNAKVIIIDKMGILDILYQISTLAILGGSFIDRVGGHNILEPVFLKTPVFFGPHMHSQEDFKKIVLENNCGKELPLNNLKSEITQYLKDKISQNSLIANCNNIKNTYQNVIDQTLQKIKKII